MNETAIAKESRMSGKQNTDFEFQACDYLDLVEVGYRQSSDYNCAPGQKFLFKVFSFSLKLTNFNRVTKVQNNE